MDQQVTDQTQGEDKNKNPEAPIPNILLLGAADSGKEAFAKQVFGREFQRVWDIGFHTAVPIPSEEPFSVCLIDSHGFEQLDGNSKSVEDYCKAMDAVLEQNRKAAAAQQIHAVWYCIAPSSEKQFEQELAILWKICGEESLRDRVAVVVLQDDAAKKGRTTPSLTASLKEAIRNKPHDGMIAFSVCSGPDLAPDGEKLIKWTADKLQDKGLQEAFVTSQAVSLRAKRRMGKA